MHGLVVQFYRGMEPMVQEKENVLRLSSLLPDGGEVVYVEATCQV